MKKVSLFFGNRLKNTIASDVKFRKTPVLNHVLALVNYVICSAATGKPEKPLCPFLAEPYTGCLPLDETAAIILFHAYRSASRIEAIIDTGPIEGCLLVTIRFHLPGKLAKPLIVLHGDVDSSGWRTLKRML